jgi:hypothetical protein
MIMVRVTGGLGVVVECGGKVAQTMYTHVSKCKNDKLKKKLGKKSN